MAKRAREIESDYVPVMQEWLEKACLGVAIEPTVDSGPVGFPVPVGPGLEIPVWEVIVHNGLPEGDREEAVIATCDSELEAELVAAALWAQVRRWTVAQA